MRVCSGFSVAFVRTRVLLFADDFLFFIVLVYTVFLICCVLVYSSILLFVGVK